jgi:hypothetical protein
MARYSVQSGGAGLIHGPHVKNRTLKLKTSCSHLKILEKLVEIHAYDSI